MWGRLHLSSAAFSAQDLDQISREFEAEIAAILGAEPAAQSPAHRAGTRGDAITLGIVGLALVKAGAVSSLFKLITSYLERGVDCTFEGATADGRAVKLQMKGVSLEQFRAMLGDVGVLK
jgi:hypothetical protein